MQKAMNSVNTLIGRVRTALGQGAACTQFCEHLYPAGPDRTKCVRDGADHVEGNLCDACTNDISRTCAQLSGGYRCCAPGQACDTSAGACT